MKKMIWIFFVGCLLVSCKKQAPVPNSLLIVGKWYIVEAKAFNDDLTQIQNYVDYRFEFVRGGSYSLIDTGGFENFGRWAMLDNGEELILDPEMPNQSTLRIEKLTNEELHLRFNETNYAYFKMKRVQ